MEYSKKVLEHFKRPHNYGKIKNPDTVGKAGNIICGDVMWLYIKVKDDIITDIKFETFGCVAAIAATSVITDLVKGKTIGQAIKISKKDIIDNLGSLPPIKIHCSLLAIDALASAIFNYLKENKRDIPKNLEKTYKRIKEENKLIKEKYKDWINLEEQIYGNKETKSGNRSVGRG